MTQPLPPVCFDCIHFRKDDPGMTCDAYPKGIPEEIALKGNNHTKPNPGDNGIRFEEKVK